MNIPFKSKLSKFKNIDNRNKAFDALSSKDKRREIAYDALNLTITRQIKASNDGYWNPSLLRKTEALKTPKELQCLLVDNLPSCKVCQRGLMMLSQIRLGNTISPQDNYKSQGSKFNLKGFGETSFRDMESLYEGWNDSLYEDLPYKNGSQGMLANICCNVIANGNFKPEDNTDYLKLWEIEIKPKK